MKTIDRRTHLEVRQEWERHSLRAPPMPPAIPYAGALPDMHPPKVQGVINSRPSLVERAAEVLPTVEVADQEAPHE